MDGNTCGVTMSDVQHRRAYLRSISRYVFIESEIKRLWSLNSFHDSRTTVSSLWSNIYICIYIYDPWYEHSRRRILSYSTAIRANKWQEIGERCVEYGEYIYIYNTCKKKSIVVASVLRFLDGLIRTDAKRSKVGPAVTMIDPLWCTSVLLDPRAFLYKHVLFFFSLNCFCVWIIVYIFGATFTTRHDVIRARVFEPANYSRKKKEKRIVQTNKFVPDNLC